MLRLTFLGLVLAVLGGAAVLPSQYSVVRPGGVYELSPRLSLPEHLRRESGWLALTAVRVREASLAESIIARFEPGAELVSTSAVRSADLSAEEQQTVKLRWMEGSKRLAALLATDRAGFPVRATGKGLLVERVHQTGPAAGRLQAGDVILTIEGRAIGDLTELRTLLAEYPIGQELELKVIRNGALRAASTSTAESSPGSGRPVLGINGSPYLLGLGVPFRYTMDTAGISGPSGGLMLSLALLDALTVGDLTGGYRVAGTGTVDEAGNVGPVGSVGGKVRAAERAQADIFLVPERNASEAAAASHTIRIVPVATLDQAIAKLEQLGGERAQVVGATVEPAHPQSTVAEPGHQSPS